MIRDEELLKQNLQLMENWPTVLEDNVKPEYLELYLKRKAAVQAYINTDTSLLAICQKYGLYKSDFYRLLKRCLLLHTDGRPFGFRALIPHFRVEKRKLTKFETLLEEHPKLRESLEKDFLNKKKKGELREFNMSLRKIHQYFIQNCIKSGIDLNEYPLNTKTKAKKSVERYLHKLKDSHFISSAAKFGDDANMKAKNTGSVLTESEMTNIIRPLERVEFDGHKIDASIALIYTTPEGDQVIDTINRIWILSIIDVATRSILGYHLCVNQEYSSDDVLMCIRNAIKPWEPMQLTIPGLEYKEDVGFPSYLIPEMQYAIWDELCYDNAKANLANIVQETLRKFVGCSVNAGPVATPVRRAFIERFFKTLESKGYQRLINTTGSGPKDPRRRKNSNEIATDYEIHVDHIHEITDVLIAEYNATPHSSLTGLTPLQILRQRIDRGMFINMLPNEKRAEFLFFTQKVKRTVRGNITKGIRPYIYYEGVRYVNDLLVNTYSLVGKKLILAVNIDDIRFVKAYLEDGSELGNLTATGKWGLRHHSLRERKAINRLKNNGEIHINISDDPIEIYHNYLMKNSSSKKIRSKLADFQRNQVSKKKRYKADTTDKGVMSDSVHNDSQYKSRSASNKKQEKSFEKLRRTIQF
ncbi:hypothetical protein MKY80_11535 [Lysinibacillus sp. FSL R5-0849]|uniref:hypothetical protein n=1 Tax=Lysinibacillus sp. FSL R5-0849 TaxID=2921660 RepID=UPI00315AA18C